MSKLRKVLKEVFPQEAFLPSPKYQESGRRFSIKKSKKEDVVGIELNALKDWPHNTKRCDALFVCQMPECADLLVVLVELKGSDVGHALKQIKATNLRLCNGARDKYEIHSNNMRKQ